jgi:hypothetical protein
MLSAWLPVLPLCGFSYSPGKNRFLDRQYQGFPDGAQLMTSLTSLRKNPAIPSACTGIPDWAGTFLRLSEVKYAFQI